MPFVLKKAIAIAVFIVIHFSVAYSQSVPDNSTRVDKNYLYDRFSEYDPNYFISNSGQDDLGQAKFQISFKFDLGFKFKKEVRSRVHKNRIYFAYTQIVFVDLYRESSPIRDINFTPMLIWEHRVKVKETLEARRSRFFFSSYTPGILHQSNGQSDGIYNRSVFKAFVNTCFTWDFKYHGLSKKIRLANISFFPQAWYWYKEVFANENEDIADYQGYGKLTTSFSFDFFNIGYDGVYPLEVSSTIIPAKYTSAVFDLKLNPFLKERSWMPYIYMQYWYGYGESLVNYDNRYNNYKPQSTFRIGIQFRSR
jgi:phospholipase A1/A2